MTTGIHPVGGPEALAGGGLRRTGSSAPARILAAAVATALAGCIVPTDFHTGESRENVDRHSAERFVPGVTSKEDVVLALGEPDAVSADGSTLAYSWRKVKAIWAAAGGYSAGIGTVERDYHLILSFDESDILTSSQFRKGSFLLDPDELSELPGETVLLTESIEPAPDPFDITVGIPPSADADAAARLAKVETRDRRPGDQRESRRKTLFDISLGRISFHPSEPDIIEEWLEARISRLLHARGVKDPRKYACDLHAFRVHTDVTPLYWDIHCEIRATLSRGPRSVQLHGSDTRRTYIWPGGRLIRGVVENALQQMEEQLTANAGKL